MRSTGDDKGAGVGGRGTPGLGHDMHVHVCYCIIFAYWQFPKQCTCFMLVGNGMRTNIEYFVTVDEVSAKFLNVKCVR